jgi:hypothetical protein
MFSSLKEAFSFFTGEPEFPDPHVQGIALYALDDSDLFGNSVAVEPSPVDDPFRPSPKEFIGTDAGATLYLERSMIGYCLVGFNGLYTEFYYLRQFPWGKVYISLPLPGFQDDAYIHPDTLNLVAYMKWLPTLIQALDIRGAEVTLLDSIHREPKASLLIDNGAKYISGSWHLYTLEAGPASALASLLD